MTTLTLEEAIDLRVEEMKGMPVQVGQDIPNPNITYGSLYGDEELKIAVIKADKTLQQRLRSLKGDLSVDTAIRNFDEEIKPRRTNRYLRPPSALTEADIFPEYTVAANRYKTTGGSGSYNRYIRGNYPESYIKEDIEPPKPMGYESALRLAGRGYDPRKEIDKEGIRAFRRIMASRGPYTPTPDDLNYGKQYLGTDLTSRLEDPDVRGRFNELFPGDFAWANPNNPDDGIAYFEEGKEPALYDSPLMTGTDALEVFVQEAPMIGTELLIGGKGIKYLDEFIKDSPQGKKLWERAVEGTAFNIVLAGGAAGARFFQLTTGSLSGAHNRDVLSMLEESGMLGLIAFGGNTVISGFMSGLPKLYRAITGRDASASDIKDIERAIQAKIASQQGEKVVTRAGEEPVSLLEIEEAMQQLGDEVGKKLKFRPTLGQATKDQYINDLEEILRTNIANPKYGKLYNEMLKGNEQVTQEFFDILFRNLDNDTTGNTVGKSFTNLFARKSLELQDEGALIIAGMRENLDNMQSAAVGKNILDDVLDLNASSQLIPRFTTRINEISRTYKDTLKADVDAAFNTPELRELTFTGRPFRNDIKAFREAGKPTGKLNIGRKQIDKTFNEIFEEGILERLTRYSYGDLSLPEINQIRVQLNSFASTLDPSKSVPEQKIFDLTRKIQDSIEESMFRTIRRNLPKGKADEVIETLNAQKYGTELANQQVIKNLMQTKPEGVIGYLFSTGTKGTKINSQAEGLIQFLRTTNSQAEINTIRNGVIDYVKRNFLDNTDTGVIQLAKNYRKFIEQNEGTLKAIFPEEQFNKIITSRQDFLKNIIQPLERLERKNSLLETKFGETNPYNIVTKILGAGSTRKASGDIIEDLDFIDDLLASATGVEKEILEKQISDAAKKYIVSRSSVDGKFDVNMLNKFMNEGFTSPGLVGENLSFEGVIGRLIQDKDSFFQYLNVLRDVGMRTQQELTSNAALRRQIQESISDPGTMYLRRFFIPPLTQFGRRTTALENIITDRNIRFMGDVLTDEKLFKAYVDAIRDTKKLSALIKILNTERYAHYRDIGSTAKFYDTDEKEQRASKKQTLTSEMKDQLMNLQNRVGVLN